jgi:hypothetical protein
MFRLNAACPIDLSGEIYQEKLDEETIFNISQKHCHKNYAA